MFAVGFGIGCIMAAGLAFYRFSLNQSEPVAPLPEWSSVAQAEGPRNREALELALPGLQFVRTWHLERPSEGLPVQRHLVRDEERRFWHINERGGGQRVQRADLLEVHGNRGIEYEALAAGLEHNNFKIVQSLPWQRIFLVKLDPFDPLGVEKSIRLLRSREPYIVDALPVYLESPYSKDMDLESLKEDDS